MSLFLTILEIRLLIAIQTNPTHISSLLKYSTQKKYANPSLTSLTYLHCVSKKRPNFKTVYSSKL